MTGLWNVNIHYDATLAGCVPANATSVLVRARARFPDAAVAWRPGDILAAFVSRGVANRVRGKSEHTAPQSWPPPDTFRQLRHHAGTALPGARVSRLLMGRCLVRWQAP